MDNLYIRTMLKQRFVFCFLFLIGFGLSGFSQATGVEPTVKIEGKKEKFSHEDLAKYHSPKKATIMSTFIPGAGQVYNKKYWKVPIVWGGIGVALYASQLNRDLYHSKRTEYLASIDGTYTGNETELSLESSMQYYRQMMETSYVIAGAVYLLQILDANVDAQLMSFDVSDDLSMNVLPQAIPNQYNPTPTMGLTFALKLK